MNLHSLLHILEGGLTSLSVTILAAMVAVSYLIYFTAQILMVRDGFKKESWGIPLIGCTNLLAVSLLGTFGPYIKPIQHLFYNGYTKWYLAAWWGLGTILVAVVFWQYLHYGKKAKHVTKGLSDHFYLTAWGTLACSIIFAVTFIVFYQDFYVNEIYPLCTLMLAISYFGSLTLRGALYGLSVPVAWMWTVATALLYLATSLGDMKDSYPGHNGYAWIYFMYALTVLLFGGYAVGLTRRRHELRPDFKPQDG